MDSSFDINVATSAVEGFGPGFVRLSVDGERVPTRNRIGKKVSNAPWSKAVSLPINRKEHRIDFKCQGTCEISFDLGMKVCVLLRFIQLNNLDSFGERSPQGVNAPVAPISRAAEERRKVSISVSARDLFPEKMGEAVVVMFEKEVCA
jgi:hypothetical protein